MVPSSPAFSTSRRVALMTSLLAISACSSVDRSLQADEDHLGTGGPITVQYHAAVYYPDEIALRHDGFIVGIEKGPRAVTSDACDLRIKPLLDAGLDREAAEKRLDDPRQMFVTHVIANHADPRRRSEVLYSAYRPYPCAGAVCGATRPRRECASWQALDALATGVRERTRAGSYTHLLVLTMGWNTVQEEAVRNFNSIADHLKSASGPGFRPLVIGVTWPSQWNSAWLDAAFKLVSFPIKARDADEVGLTWLGVLLHETLPDAGTGLPVVAIGHSFGSRALSVAACVGPTIYRDSPDRGRAPIDTLVNLEGAYLATRLFGQPENRLAFPDRCPNVRLNAYTASIHDEAVGKILWGPLTGYYVGDKRSYDAYCRQPNGIACGKVEPSGAIGPIAADARIVYLDADALIRYNAYLTGGGAHSDIYRAEHGVLLHRLITRDFGQP